MLNRCLWIGPFFLLDGEAEAGERKGLVHGPAVLPEGSRGKESSLLMPRLSSSQRAVLPWTPVRGEESLGRDVRVGRRLVWSLGGICHWGRACLSFWLTSSAVVFWVGLGRLVVQATEV